MAMRAMVSDLIKDGESNIKGMCEAALKIAKDSRYVFALTF